jgi:hypothetical protein
VGTLTISVELYSQVKGLFSISGAFSDYSQTEFRKLIATETDDAWKLMENLYYKL